MIAHQLQVFLRLSRRKLFLHGMFSRLYDHIRGYRDKLQRLHEELEAMQSDIGATNGSLTMEQMARELHVNTVMVEYKLAALRLRGYDFGELALPGYERVFRERL